MLRAIAGMLALEKLAMPLTNTSIMVNVLHILCIVSTVLRLLLSPQTRHDLLLVYEQCHSSLWMLCYK